MKFRKLETILMIFVLFLLFSYANVFAAEEQYILKFSLNSPEGVVGENPETTYAHVMKDYIEKESKGRIKVDIYASAQLGTMPEVFMGLSSGSIEFALLNTAILQNFKKECMVLAIPGIFASMEECDKILDSDWLKKFYQDMTDKTGVMVTHQFSNGLRHFSNSKKELRKPEDAEGLVFRVMESPVSIAMVEALGAKAVPMASAELYSALQNKVIDGLESPVAGFNENKLYEVQKYYVLDGHVASMVAGVMSKKFYDSLPVDLQKIVMDGSKAGRDIARTIMITFEKQGLALMESKGVKVYQPTDEELKAWHDAVAGPATEYVKSQIGVEIVNELLGVINSVRK
jgi:C4-dicarboxylate-binding protein DctP